MTRSLRIVVSHAVSAFALLAGATVAQAQQKKPDAGVKPQPPLSPMASQHVMVLPVQLMRADSGAWIDASKWEKFRRELDDSIGSMIANRGVGKTWKYASDVVRIAKRNPDYVNDPYAMGVQSMRSVKYKIGDPIPDLFNNNLRLLIGIADTRYVLLPVEVYFAKKGPQQIAVMKLALVDGRGDAFVWLGEVGTDPATEMSPALINSLASRIADLVVAP
ncbi:MAG TPA: hypothetical protein VGQ30_02325 [Gemmatimonadaceae bacterium]|jgi:hypothetical protein|nr:hypothetical protein [Gemmatimonadaceae bacterium]